MQWGWYGWRKIFLLYKMLWGRGSVCHGAQCNVWLEPPKENGLMCYTCSHLATGGWVALSVKRVPCYCLSLQNRWSGIITLCYDCIWEWLFSRTSVCAGSGGVGDLCVLLFDWVFLCLKVRILLYVAVSSGPTCSLFWLRNMHLCSSKRWATAPDGTYPLLTFWCFKPRSYPCLQVALAHCITLFSWWAVFSSGMSLPLEWLNDI